MKFLFMISNFALLLHASSAQDSGSSTTSLVYSIFNSAVKGAAGDITNEAVGWALGALGLASESDDETAQLDLLSTELQGIQSTLDSISTQLTTIEQTLKQDGKVRPSTKTCAVAS